MKKLILLALLFTSCATVPDIPVCTEISPVKGFCTNTVSDVDFFIDDKHPHAFGKDKTQAKTWWELRPYMVYVPFPSWAELKAYIIKQCKRTDCASYVSSWERKLSEMDKKITEE